MEFFGVLSGDMTYNIVCHPCAPKNRGRWPDKSTISYIGVHCTFTILSPIVRFGRSPPCLKPEPYRITRIIAHKKPSFLKITAKINHYGQMTIIVRISLHSVVICFKAIKSAIDPKSEFCGCISHLICARLWRRP